MSSREAFENSQGKDLSLATRNDGTYISVATSIAWDAWQAATERAANLVSDAEPIIGIVGVAVVVAKIREGNE